MSLRDRIGNALKAGGKSAADSILGPGDNMGQQLPMMPPGGLPMGNKSSGIPSWALPAAGAALLLFLITKK